MADEGVRSRSGDAERGRRSEERLDVLSAVMRAFAEATTDLPRLLATVARRVAEVIGDYCLVQLLSEDGLELHSVAMYCSDAAALARAHDAFREPVPLSSHPLATQVLESGEPFFARRIDLERLRPPRTPLQVFAFVRDMEIHSLLMVPLRGPERALGQLILSRYRPDSPAFDEDDRELASNLADLATLAISNARLLVAARHEFDERRRSAERLQLLIDVFGEFSAATNDHDRLLAVVARRLGDLLGDACAIRTLSADGAFLESGGAIYHPDPELMRAMQESMDQGPQRVGEGISGRVAASGKPVLVPQIDPIAFAASSVGTYRALLERLQITSAITIPLIHGGAVVGVANLMRSAPSRPYGDDDLRFVQSIADQAALAIGNARSYAAERAARAAAEEATQALREAEARFARLSECGIIGILVSDLSGRVIEVNDAVLGWLGYAREEILSGRVSWTDLTLPEWQEVDARAIAQLTRSGIAGLREKEYVRKDGRRLPVLVGSAMLEDAGQSCISFIVDLTERKAAEAAVEQLRRERRASAKFRKLLEAAPDAMVIVDAGGVVVLINARAEALFGYARVAVIGQPVERLIADRGGQPLPYFRHADGATPAANLELRGRRRDGTELPIEVSVSPLETEEGLLVSVSIRDITDRHRAEQQRARLAAIVDASDDAIIGKTLEGVVTSWNDGARRLFGYPADEVVGRSIALLVPPGQEDEEAEILKTLAGGTVMRFDTIRRRKDGRDIDVSVTISPVRDADGVVCAISKVARDITERRRAETALARARDVAESASRELEAFSYSVAHDLRAPLRGMNGFAQVLLDTYKDRFDAEGQDWLTEILLNAKKMAALIDALLSLSRVTRSEIHRQPVDLSALVRSAVGELSAGEPGRVVEAVIEDGVVVELDPTLARSLVQNLVGNAWKFSRDAVAPRIELGTSRVDGVRACYVRDNGAGFDMQYAHRLFAPFQRLHSNTEFAGTGIGLATVHRILRRHGGRIWAEGAVNGGATFFFTVPDGLRVVGP